MRRSLTCIVLLILLLAPSCSRNKIIPRSDLVDIYVEMYLADQWLKDNVQYRNAADTCLVFDPIFRAYGYTFDDFNRTLIHYSGDPESFSEVMADVVQKLTEQAEHYAALSDANNEAIRLNRQNRVNYKEVDFDTDSLWIKSVDILWPVLDSIMIATADSLVLQQVSDTLTLATDSLVLKDRPAPLRRTRARLAPADTLPLRRPMQAVPEE